MTRFGVVLITALGAGIELVLARTPVIFESNVDLAILLQKSSNFKKAQTVLT
jgi:hypothetical protein